MNRSAKSRTEQMIRRRHIVKYVGDSWTLPSSLAPAPGMEYQSTIMRTVRVAHIRPKRQLQIHFPGVLVLRGERKPFYGVVKDGGAGSWTNAPSVSPLVNTSVRSTLVSPIWVGSRTSSAKQVTFMNFPPAILGGPLGVFGGNGGGEPLPSAG